ncbi:hypothetical protein ASPWEDRAFT_45486 [Aspergillus wentii DTO 134E9]|uniref:Uncharacterized protein n=1 Tax=Aspergillus wentii DTO 134E9 TaxID=1073089 RepID=A0A1L9R9D9_ASPWE|nr:uncharacterized protein ASPWEDRAFT_45486 [Aspergillus wentii DTO 134E9]OJJ31541.1 hypothetical protein ASPWEDRAFT_45486 [Aspergillus wentii DTO 134E9]
MSSSHKSNGGRIPRPKDFASQSRSASSPVTTSSATSGAFPISLFPKPQMNTSSRTSRTLSVSDAAQGSQIPAPSRPVKTTSNSDVRLSFLPRPNTQSLPRASHRSPISPLTTGQTTQSPSGPVAKPQPTPKTDKQASVSNKARNILRRKAPTIGQRAEHTIETARPGKLSVIIPNSVRPTQAMNATPRNPWDQPELARLRTSLSVSQDKTAQKSAEPQPQAIQAPKELASLRTTVNTQNLPPPTPNFPSASTPSTRYSSSPGIWSRGSTPTSVSSYSPGIVQPVKFGYRSRHPSPSQFRLPFFSPISYASPQSDRLEQNASKSPNLEKGAGSSTSLLVQGELEISPKSTGPAKAVTPSNSLLPRRSSLRPSLPTKAKPDAEPAHKKDEIKRPSIDRRASMGATKTLDPSKDSKQQSPRRPSRDGTDRLELEPSPVIRSNVPPKSVTSHKRRESAENSPVRQQQPPSQSAAASVDSLHSRSTSQLTLPTSISPVISRKSPQPQPLTQDPKKKQEVKTPAPKRFGLFPKKSKSDFDRSTLEQIKATRKGPAAGTGHEGYGKYSGRGRKTSTSSNSTRPRSNSLTSAPKPGSSIKGGVKGRPDLNIDNFFLDRLEPVVINGGGMDEAALTRTRSEQSVKSAVSSSGSTINLTKYSKGSHSTGYSTDSLATSTDTIEPEPEPKVSKPGAASDSYQTAGQSSMPVPPESSETTPLTRFNSTAPLPVDNYSLSPPHTSASDHPPLSEKKDEPQSREKSPSKMKGLGMKWSFFQRSHGSGRKNSTPEETPNPSVPQLHATIAPIAANRPVAHYAFVDTDSDPLEEIMHRHEDSPPTEDEPESPVTIPEGLNIRKTRESTLLPEPPKLQGELPRDGCSSPKVYFRKDSTATVNSEKSPERSPKDTRPSRLASVGRIPRVVSRRDRQHKPAMQSFSRPFSYAESPSLTAPVLDKPHERSLSDHSAVDFQPRPYNPGFDVTKPFGDPMQGSVLDFIAGPYAKNEFLKFSPDKGSVVSSASDSERFSAVTAVVPGPSSEPTEDEVWGEYDDLIDHVLSPESPQPEFPGQTDEEEKFELATMASKTLQAELDGNADQNTLPTLPEHPAEAPTRSGNGSIRLRRSRIASALRTSVGPPQPSYDELVAKYGDPQSEDKIHMAHLDNLPAPTQPVEQQPDFIRPPSLKRSQSFETCRQRNTVLFDIAERDREGPTAQTNLRSGSLMTSRWLSFGRVLFSPAHNHVKTGEQERILVIDGLGNDDWSFYCSLTYPHADVYNLNIGPTPSASTHPAAWQPPSNHHTVYHSSFDKQIPFPKGFFAVTVLRFPAACAEKVQDNIVAECKRVLRPGGYMEMSLLDLDMVNMGIRTRKAVRRLKERTYLADANISLKPASDSIQRFLGRHGFDNLRRCMVRIPVAGMIVRSSASSSSTDSSYSNLSMSAAATSTFSLPAKSTLTTSHGKCPSNDTDLSLGDLLSDPSPSNDESIRKIVAKVGRWWYTRCYEIPVLPGGDVDLSIWADRKILRECQRRGTGFRFLIAYAQKPSEVKRRTASV